MDPQNITNEEPDKQVRELPEPTVPKSTPQLEPVVHVMNEKQKRHLPTLVGYILAAFLVAIAVVWFGRWLYQKTTHKTTQPAPTANTSKVPDQPTNNTTAGQTTSGSPTFTSSTNTNNNSTSNTSTNSQLPNSGPGDVIAIFIGASVVFGGIHYLFSLRHSS